MMRDEERLSPFEWSVVVLVAVANLIPCSVPTGASPMARTPYALAQGRLCRTVRRFAPSARSQMALFAPLQAVQ